MYSLYSVLVLIVAVLASPWFIYQALRYKKYVGSLGQRMGYLPVSFNMDGDESIWIHAVSVGEVLTARPLISDLKRRYPNLRMFLSTTTMAGQQLARRNVQDVDAVFYFPFDLRLRRPPHARPGAAEALHHDGDRDLAEPAARMPRPRHQDRGRQRPPLGAIVPALPDDPPDDAPRARSHRQVPGAERRVGAPLHRSRRRSRRASSSPAA